MTDAASRTATSSFTVKVNSAGIDGIIAQVGGMSNDVNIVIIGKKSLRAYVIVRRWSAPISPDCMIESLVLDRITLL